MRIARLLRPMPCGAHRRAPCLLAALATLATLAQFAVASALGAGAVQADDRDTNPPVSSPPPVRLSPPPRELPNAAPDREIVDLYRPRARVGDEELLHQRLRDGVQRRLRYERPLSIGDRKLRFRVKASPSSRKLLSFKLQF